jgi:hypothetical protein
MLVFNESEAKICESSFLKFKKEVEFFLKMKKNGKNERKNKNEKTSAIDIFHREIINFLVFFIY